MMTTLNTLVNKRYFLFLAALGLALPPQPALALPQKKGPCCREGAHPRWYAAISGSAVFLRDTQITHSSPLYSNPDGQSYKPGYGVSGAIGYRVLSGVRVELEVADRQSKVRKDPGVINALEPGQFSAQRSTAFMANTYIDLHNNSPLTPYFGVGVGAAYVKNPRYYVDLGTMEASKKLTAWTLAYQFMTGVTYELEGTPFELGFGYRYFTGQDAEATSNLSNFPSKVKFPNDSHNLEATARMNF